MRAAGTLFVVVTAISSSYACTCTDDGMLISSELGGGSGVILREDVDLTMGPVIFTGPSVSPARTTTTSFEFDFNNGPTMGDVPQGGLSCMGASWSALSQASQPVSLANLCSLGPPALHVGNIDVDLSSAVGTITATSMLDHNGNGTIDLQLDIPSVELVGTDDSNMTHKVHVEVDALHGMAMYASESCGGGGEMVIPVL